MSLAANDPLLRSFVPVADDGHFPIQNLPFGSFSRRTGERPRIGVAIGDMVLDLAILSMHEVLKCPSLEPDFFARQENLNEFLRRGQCAWRETRDLVSRLLRHDNATLRDHAPVRDQALVRQVDVQMHLPVHVGNYTDFYSSKDHATNVGVMLRGPKDALMPNWLHLPVAYHGRASSIVVSGTNVQRPLGQTMADAAPAPLFGPCRNLDFELEMGFLVGPGNALGHPIPITDAEKHIFGLVLVNDWSARDIQKWEYQPLGPFLSKNFATSVSPWVVTLDALTPFRVPGPVQDPEPLPYLRSTGNWSLDAHLEVHLHSEHMESPECICRSNAQNLYWNIAQQLAHHTVNGCNLQPGDLLASGTISGPTPDSYGSLLELAWRGTKPLQFPNGETRAFLSDGDRVTLTGWCQGPAYRVGFGEVTGKVLSARSTGQA